MKIGGSLARKARFDAPTSLVSSLWFSCSVAVSMGDAAKSLLFEGFQAGCHVVLRGKGGTLHSTLHHTLHFALYTPPHSTLCTLLTPHFKLKLYTPHSTLDTFHSTLYTPHFTLHTPHSTIYTLHSSLHTLHFTLCTFHSPFTLYTLHSTLHNLHFGLHTLNFALHTLHLWG